VKATVRKFDGQRQFGFAETDQGVEVLVRQAEVMDGTPLRVGLRIEFDDAEEPSDGRRPIAIGISGTGKDAGGPKVPDGPQKGFVRKYDPERRIGWLKPAGRGGSIFFSGDDLQEETVIGGMAVMFELRQRGNGRPSAVNVRRTTQRELNGE